MGHNTSLLIFAVVFTGFEFWLQRYLLLNTRTPNIYLTSPFVTERPAIVPAISWQVPVRAGIVSAGRLAPAQRPPQYHGCQETLHGIRGWLARWDIHIIDRGNRILYCQPVSQRFMCKRTCFVSPNSAISDIDISHYVNERHFPKHIVPKTDELSCSSWHGRKSKIVTIFLDRTGIPIQNITTCCSKFSFESCR